MARCDLAVNRASEMAGTRKAGGKKGGKRKHGVAGKGRKKRPSGGDMGPALAGGQRLSGASKYLEDVMAVFRGLPGQPMNARQVASTMGVSDKDIQEMLHVLMRQEAGKGKLKEVGKGRFMLPEGQDQRDNRRGNRRRDQAPTTGDRKAAVQGTIQITAYGKGFVSVPGQSDDIMVPKGNTGTAFWGDTVELGWMRRSSLRFRSDQEGKRFVCGHAGPRQGLRIRDSHRQAHAPGFFGARAVLERRTSGCESSGAIGRLGVSRRPSHCRGRRGTRSAWGARSRDARHPPRVRFAVPFPRRC